MRKKIMILIISVISISCFLAQKTVKASYAYLWTVNGEDIVKGSSNKAGNVTWNDDTTYTGGILNLNNYNGGQLKIDCYGTGLGHVFAIKLVGDNTITVKNGVGIIANAPIVFIGDGKLTIDASIPIGSGAVINNDGTGTDVDKAKYSKQTNIVIEPKTEINNNEINEDTNKENNDDKETVEQDSSKNNDDKETIEQDSDKNNDEDIIHNKIIESALIGYSLLSLIIIVVLIVKILMSQKKKSI